MLIYCQRRVCHSNCCGPIRLEITDFFSVKLNLVKNPPFINKESPKSPVCYNVIKHAGHLKNTAHVFYVSQVSEVFYHIVIHGLGFFICFMMQR